VITKAEAKAIWERVKANGAKLDACPKPHDFQDVTPTKPIGKRYRCSKCTGEEDGRYVGGYLDGLKHGAKAT
jgi:hypothetical protein